MTTKEIKTYEKLQELILTSEWTTQALADMLKLLGDMKAVYSAENSKPLNEKITYADMLAAADKWSMNGKISEKQNDSIRESLALAFHIAISEYLTAKTNLVCGKSHA